MIALPPDFDTVMTMSGEVYRKQPLRETLLVTINDQQYFIKRHFGITLKECLKNWVSGRLPILGAKTEWKAIQALNALGILTTPLVHYGQRGLWPFSQQSFVLTRALMDTVSLETLCNQWPSSPPSFQKKMALIDEVARITRLLHTQGWVHRDLYLCHFLRNESGQLHLIDLHRMFQPRFCLQTWKVKDLSALLFSSLDIGLTRHDLFRFIKVYTQLPLKEALNVNQKIFDQVNRRAGALYQRLHFREPKQSWMLSGKSFSHQKTGNTRTKSRFTKNYTIHQDYDSLYTKTLTDHPEAYFHSSAVYLKEGDSSTVVKAMIGDHVVVIKRYNRINFITRLKRYFGRSKAKRAWKSSHILESIGIATPRSVAYIEYHFGGLGGDSYFVSEFVEGQRLDHFIASTPPESEMLACAHALYEMMQILNAGLCQHGDLKASNILWNGKNLILLDVDAVKLYSNRAFFNQAHAEDWKRLLRNWTQDHPFHKALNCARTACVVK